MNEDRLLKFAYECGLVGAVLATMFWFGMAVIWRSYIVDIICH